MTYLHCHKLTFQQVPTSYNIIIALFMNIKKWNNILKIKVSTSHSHSSLYYNKNVNEQLLN